MPIFKEEKEHFAYHRKRLLKSPIINQLFTKLVIKNAANNEERRLGKDKLVYVSTRTRMKLTFFKETKKQTLRLDIIV